MNWIPLLFEINSRFFFSVSFQSHTFRVCQSEKPIKLIYFNSDNNSNWNQQMFLDNVELGRHKSRKNQVLCFEPEVRCIVDDTQFPIKASNRLVSGPGNYEGPCHSFQEIISLSLSPSIFRQQTSFQSLFWGITRERYSVERQTLQHLFHCRPDCYTFFSLHLTHSLTLPAMIQQTDEWLSKNYWRVGVNCL